MGEAPEIRNARIESTMLGYEDHGILSSYVHLLYGGSGQGFGGYVLDGPWDDIRKERMPSAGCGAFIAAVLKATGIESWEKLPGKPVRAYATHSKVTGLGHFLDDKWAYHNGETFVVGTLADMQAGATS